MEHFVSGTCEGEKCFCCGEPAKHKVGEQRAVDTPAEIMQTHGLTTYLCCKHFTLLMGDATPCDDDSKYGKAFPECGNYEELCHQLTKLPDTWIPGLLNVMVRTALTKPIFKEPNGLANFVKNIKKDFDKGEDGDG